jgi:hypothetical protein
VLVAVAVMVVSPLPELLLVQGVVVAQLPLVLEGLELEVETAVMSMLILPVKLSPWVTDHSVFLHKALAAVVATVVLMLPELFQGPEPEAGVLR